MNFENTTPCPALAFDALDPQSKEFHVIALRMTLDVNSQGALELSKTQSLLLMTDEWYGELNKSSVRQESDLAPYKPWCDVVVLGEALSPTGKRVRQFEAGLRLTRKGETLLDKRLTITGPRQWKKRLVGGWTLTRPEPLASLPLRYEDAFGGECRVMANDPGAKKLKTKFRLTPEQRGQHPDGLEKAPVAHACSFANPIGRGYAEEWYLRATHLTSLAAPQIESPLNPIKKFKKQYAPQGLGVMGRAWRPRLDLCGTMDEAFIQSQKPLPADFNFAYWNGAHPDMQMPWMYGDETIDLINIPFADQGASRVDSQGNRITRLTLPGHLVAAFVTFENGPVADHDFHLDTMVVDAEKKKVFLTYRLKIDSVPRIETLSAELLTQEERNILADHVRSVNEQATRYAEVMV